MCAEAQGQGSRPLNSRLRMDSNIMRLVFLPPWKTVDEETFESGK